MLGIAAIQWSLDGIRVKLLLTFVALFISSFLMQVQIGSYRRRYNRARFRPLLLVGLAAIVISQAAFLALVWSGQWRAWPAVWRTWWISMVPSVFVSHLLLLPPRRGLAERAARLCIVWAGLMILWPGLRDDMLADLPPVYLWVGAVPAVGTVILSIYLAVRELKYSMDSEKFSRRAWTSGLLTSHLVVVIGAFYVGRATSGRRTPDDLVGGVVSDVARQATEDQYEVQKAASEWLGDTRISSRAPFVTIEQINVIKEELRPGDIILERRNWYLSNPFLPGFWPHSALYVGTPEQLHELGVIDSPAFLVRWDDYFTPDEEGHHKAVIEAMSEGVVLTSPEHSLHADYVAVLRPRLSREQIAEAVIRAFENLGLEYDFNFDFNDTSRLVCSQVIYVAYEGMLEFDLVRVMGRDTLPCIEFAKKYAAQREDEDRALDFILFYDVDSKAGRAVRATEKEFLESLDRPKALVEHR
jgi:hypothetical protein